MKFVTTCASCGNPFVPNNGREWCRKCADRFVEDLTKTRNNPDEWYIISDIGNDIVDENGPTKKAADIQRDLNTLTHEMLSSPAVDKGLREIFAKYNK